MVLYLSRRLLFLTTFMHSVIASCPVHKSCTCDDKSDGYYIVCDSPIGTTLPEIMHTLGKRQVQKLTVTNASWPKLEELPMTNIRSLQLISCGIKTITNTAFSGLSDNLEDLTIVQNMLTTVPSLGYLPKLISLNLNYNQLTDLPDNALRGAQSLRHLRLEGNKICSLSSNSLLDLKNILELLDLSDNCLSNIPAQHLRNCIQLMYLDLSENIITEIANFELMNLPLLKELRINNNQISNIAPMAFLNVPLLEHLYLKNNQISSMETGRLFQVFKNLEVLDLSHNMLTKIPSFKELLNLRQVYLDHNSISRIDTLAFTSNSKLQLINLQNNHIVTMSRNSFDSLDELVILNLANNSIKKIERGMLDGMQNLQQLNLRNNSLSVLEDGAFISVPKLTVLDLAYNGIHKIEKDVFMPLKSLFWLDLSSNRIKTLEEDTFKEKIANILLNDNPLYCDKKLDWLVSYLVENQIRTFLPYQTEVLCAGPSNYAGVRLKELMIVKANETISTVKQSSDVNYHGGFGRDLLNSIIPAGFYGLLPIWATTLPPSQIGATPVIDTFTNINSTFKNIPRTSYLPEVKGQRADEIHKLNAAIEQFSAPLIRAATGGQTGPTDIEQIIQAIPNLIVSVPGIGDIDISKLPPGVLTHVLHGGKIPGLPPETTDKITKEYLKRMYAAAQAAKQRKLQSSESRYLPPLNTLPQELITEVMHGADLPYLDQQQTQTIRDYYTSKLSVGDDDLELRNLSTGKSKTLPSTVIEVIRMLPPGYNISKIPKPVTDALFRGEVPDFALLPDELQKHLFENGHRLIAALSTDGNKTVEEILRNLPTFKRPIQPTFIPYDINEVSSDLTQGEQQAEKLVRVQYYTALLLGFVGATSIAVLGLICVYMKRKRLMNTEPEIDEDSLVNPSQVPQKQQPTNESGGSMKLDFGSQLMQFQSYSDSARMFSV